MIDYYEELGLDRSLGLDELNHQLSRAESVWKSRRTRTPEAATKKLASIADARRVFSSPEARANYDAALDGKEEQAQEEQEAVDWFKLALEAALIRDWRATLAHSENGLLQDSTDDRLWRLKSHALRELGDMVGALTAARQRVRFAPYDSDAHAGLAMVLRIMAAPPPSFELLPGYREDMEEARDEYCKAVDLGDERCATEVALCCEFLNDWDAMLTWSTRAIKANKYDEFANAYYAEAVAVDAESKLSGGTTITNAKQLAYMKSSLAKIKGLDISVCSDTTHGVIQDIVEKMQEMIAEAEHTEWRGFRYGQMSGYAYAARTLPQALVKTGLQ